MARTLTTTHTPGICGFSALLLAACSGAPAGEATASDSEALAGAPVLIATATLERATDFAGASDVLENGLPQNVLGGIGSGLTYAGGTTFLALPDRGPNATAIPNGSLDDNTTSFISRVETLDLALTPASSGALPFTLNPTLLDTTLLYSSTPLAYGSTPGLPNAVPALNTAEKFYFSGRSDNFGAGSSLDPSFARFDPEAIRISADGSSFFVADEYGPYVYRFDRATGRRIRSYVLPEHFAITNLSPVGATEIAGNTQGRVTNKGAEGLAITPDGNTLVVLLQSPLLQDGGDGGRANRLVTVDVESGATHEYVYDNKIGSKAYNSSEIIALNDHQFLIDTRDGKGLGDGSVAVIKQLWAVDIAGATDVASLSGESTLLKYAVPKQLFLDLVPALTANGFTTAQIPAKIEGLAFGADVTIGGIVNHTLYIGNDNDFVPAVAGPNRWFVFGVTDAYLAQLGLFYTPQQIVPRGADLRVTKTASQATAVTGSTVEYTLGVSNNGVPAASGVVLSDALPPELMLAGCGSAGTCTTTANGADVAFDSLGRASGQSATITTTLSCAVADGTLIVNQAMASSSAADPTPEDNHAAATITAVNPAPSIDGLSVDKPVLWPPNDKLTLVRVSYEVSDNCPGTVCALAATSSEAGSGDTVVVDAHTVQLRAARDGNGPGRTYSLEVTCTDSGGSISARKATVVVPHNR